MRILLVTTDYLPNVSGIATLSHEEAVGLAKLGHEVQVLTLTPGGSFDDVTLAKTHKLYILREEISLPPIVRLVSLIKRLRQVVLNYKPDFIWCTNYRGFGLPVHIIARAHALPYGIYFHGTELITESRTIVRKALLRKVASDASVVCTNSKNSAALLLKKYGIPATVATPGVHMPEDSDGDEAKVRQLREQWLNAVERRDANVTVFIAACRMSRQKGLYVILEAIAKLEPALREQTLFVAVGSGRDLEDLRQLSKKLQLCQYVHFHGPAARSDIPMLLRAADVYLQPSQPQGDFLESFGISFLEAQSVGLPCIATRWGGIPEAVRDGETALLVEPGSVEAVVNAIGKVLTDPEWCKNAIKPGIRWARQNTWANHAKCIESLIFARRVVRD